MKGANSVSPINNRIPVCKKSLGFFADAIGRTVFMTGEVVFLFAFDVANEIRTEGIEMILSRKSARLERWKRYFGPKENEVQHPLSVELEPLDSRFHSQEIRIEIRIYDVGSVSILMRIGFEDWNWDQLASFHRPVLEHGQSFQQIAQDFCQRVCRDLGTHLVRPSPPSEPEVYTVFCLKRLDYSGNLSNWFLHHRAEVAGLLVEFPSKQLSESQIVEVLRQQRTFAKTDLTIIDSDRAMIVDLDGDLVDVVHVLELANIQLEEFRRMDASLDRYLNEAYEDLERQKFSWFGLSAPILRKLRWFRVDVTKLADEVSHTTKFFGDWYLAQIYLSAKERFHLDAWRSSVEKRLAQLDQLYSVVHSELYERRMFWLELVIVLFFAFDLILLSLKK